MGLRHRQNAVVERETNTIAGRAPKPQRAVEQEKIIAIVCDQDALFDGCPVEMPVVRRTAKEDIACALHIVTKLA